ncbi:hypothetical protein [Tateyamaria omphalii]|uniref:DUF1440 domain-containing protein n=1 Tax=Tateyamaria omphalii TaxID=299262 RepID=A0A1P8MZ51_9RHOB|nr:hypothetical protein [Tateyamaria omphalii]APX13360.1 hypothetical protein BWR18_17990 [Tateyamaria omphalii]
MNTQTLRTAGTVLTAGAFATIAFDVFGQALSPLFGYAKLAPVGLAGASIKAIFGANPSGAAYLLHALTGLIFYAVGWFAIARPIQRAILPRLHWSLTAVAYGTALWVFALYFMAHLVTGNAPFLGFTGITWVALWGHIVYALVAAGIMEAKGAVLNIRRNSVAVPAE